MLRVLILLLGVSAGLYGQPQVRLMNASFEGEPQEATTPVNWFECTRGTTPDILPGVWQVNSEAYDGNTYVGLITRHNGTFESIGQRLSDPLKPGECYEFSVRLAHSRTYSGFNKPVKLRVWGGIDRCGRHQLIMETDFVRHADWKAYEKVFTANSKINYIILEAHVADQPTNHRGNILLDAVSPIVKCIRASL